MLHCIHCPGSKTTANLDQLKHGSVSARVWVRLRSLWGSPPPVFPSWVGSRKTAEERRNKMTEEETREDTIVYLLKQDAERSKRDLTDWHLKRKSTPSDRREINGQSSKEMRLKKDRQSLERKKLEDGSRGERDGAVCCNLQRLWGNEQTLSLRKTWEKLTFVLL